MTIRPVLAGLALVGVLLGTAASAAADSPHDIDLTSDGNSWQGSFGYTNTATYGQTITVPEGVATIQDFSFVMDVPAALVFRGVVQAWDGTKATGPTLYMSGPRSSSGSGSEVITFSPDVAVTPGQYVLYATASQDYATNELANGGASILGNWPIVNPGSYPGGAGVYDNNGSDFASLTTSAWEQPGGGYDRAFAVTFGLPVAPPGPADPADPVTDDPTFTG